MSEEAAGLYLHVPFCARICPYCDFAVLRGGEDRRRRFVEDLKHEIRSWRGAFETVDTVYFGGGTPSLLSTEALQEILEALRENLDLREPCFLTLEANPEDVSPEKLEDLLGLGFGMISLGVQSLDDRQLRFLGRHHSSVEAHQAVKASKKAGFEIVSLDLIYGLPGQDPAAWRRDLEFALELKPDHLSCYQLTIEEKTVFGKQARQGDFAELESEAQAEFFDLTHRLLEDRGFAAYEVSNFARSPNHRSPHNQKYWRHAPYLGLGPSSHSFRRRRRWWNHRHLETWSRSLGNGSSAIADHEDLSQDQLAFETLFLGLRQPSGIDLSAFEKSFGFALQERNVRLVDDLVVEGLLHTPDHRLRPTLRGLAIAEGLAMRFNLEGQG